MNWFYTAEHVSCEVVTPSKISISSMDIINKPQVFLYSQYIFSVSIFNCISQSSFVHCAYYLVIWSPNGKCRKPMWPQINVYRRIMIQDRHFDIENVRMSLTKYATAKFRPKLYTILTIQPYMWLYTILIFK